MNIFKVGDRVKLLNDNCVKTNMGEIVTVTGLYEPNWIEFIADHGETCSHEQDYFELFKKRDPMDNLKQGDVLVEANGTENVVQGVLGEIVFYTWGSSSYGYTTLKNLKDDGWHLKDSTDTTEKTVAELEKELGMAAGTLRIKK